MKFSISTFRILGDKFGESLGGGQAPPSFWKVPGLPRKLPQLPRKFFGDFPGSSLTVELNSNPGVPRKFPRLPRNFPELPRRFPGLPRSQPPFAGKPDTLSGLAKTSSEIPHKKLRGLVGGALENFNIARIFSYLWWPMNRTGENGTGEPRPLHWSGSPKPHPSKPHPCNMPQAKTEVALQFLECCAADVRTATFAFLQCGRHLYQKLRCSRRKTALQHRNRCVAGKWRFPAPLSCRFQAPTFRHHVSDLLNLIIFYELVEQLLRNLRKSCHPKTPEAPNN